MISFPCTQCGACCKSISGIDFLATYDRGDGQCKYLDESTNQCRNYENRPLLCNIDRAFEELFHNQMSKSEYYRLNALACNTLQEQQGIGVNYRLPVDE